MIDRATGRILFEGDVALTLDPTLTKSAFLKAMAPLKLEGRVVTATFTVYSIVGRLAGRTWNLSPGFDGEVLRSVGMGYAPSGGPSDDWENEERAKAGEYEDLIRLWLGKLDHTFPWGRVTASFDEKGGGGAMCVYYRAANRAAT
ncbi:MAG TPA: hypothetical protein VM222_07345 [Planctomycetota bacterium]|nr:hypothetical protein [Planctomycetota bacterium]